MNRHMYFRQQEKNYLAHHGIKGQKWGIRRYQNPDGSYTEEGKSRYKRTSTRKILSKDDFKYDGGNLEYFGNKEFCSIIDPDRLKTKYGVTKEQAITRLNNIRNDQNTIENAKKEAINDLNKYGPKFGKEYAKNLRYSGATLTRDNDIELLFDVYDESNKNIHGFSSVWIDEKTKKPINFDYSD